MPSNGTSGHIIRYPRMNRGIHFADFMRDERINVYHCIIQRVGVNEILTWTQHHSLEAAMESAEAELRVLVGSIAAGM